MRRLYLHGSPNPVRIRLGRHSHRTLIDTGAEISFIIKRIYRVLQPKPEMLKKKIRLQTVNRSPIQTDGQAQ